MSRTARRIETQGTLPGGAAYTPDDEDYVSAEERAQILAMFKPAGRQRFLNEAEQREYLRLVEALQKPEPIITSTRVWLVLAAIAAGVVTGLIWRHYRLKKAQPKPMKTKIGLDLLGATS